MTTNHFYMLLRMLFLLKDLFYRFCYIGVADAVETIFSNMKLFVQTIRQRIKVVNRVHGLMERGIKNSDIFDARKMSFKRLDDR